VSRGTENVLRFDDFGFRTLHEGDDFVVFCLGNVKRLQRGVGVFEKDRPIAFADAHSLMGELHVTALVVQRAAGSGDEKIHDELPQCDKNRLAIILCKKEIVKRPANPLP
jgi:hypothetical protein